MYEALQRLLSRVAPDLDTREGSIIWDALSIVAPEILNLEAMTELTKSQTYLMTAMLGNLDLRAEDFGMTRLPATNAILRARFRNSQNTSWINVPIGSRFNLANTGVEDIITYSVTQNLTDSTGAYSLIRCEQAGTRGNAFPASVLLPLQTITGLGSASVIGTQYFARNEESDADFRRRVLDRINRKPFGGNISDYKEMVRTLDPDGRYSARVFPIWDGGGTVQLSVVDVDFFPISYNETLRLKSEIDPAGDTGLGMGLAPIGHQVDVVTPSYMNVDLRATIYFNPDITSVGQITGNMCSTIGAVFKDVRSRYPEPRVTEMRISTARVITEIMKMPGVENVSSVDLGAGTGNDRVIPIYSTNQGTQYVPRLGVFIGVFDDGR